MSKQFSTSLFIVFVLCALILPLFIHAQVAGSKAKVNSDRQAILIGEPIKVTLEADIPENEAIGFFRKDSIPHFEILRSGKIDTANTSKGTVLTQVIWITSFDSGHWVIPGFLLRDSIFTDSIPVDVGYTAFDASKPYHDIRDIIDVDEEKEQDHAWWWLISLAVLLVAAGLFFYLRRKKKPEAVALKPVDPFEEAISQLKDWQGKTQEPYAYYSALTDIFRLYLSRRKGIESLKQTTDELVYKMRESELNRLMPDELPAALRMGDMVKFARFEPTADDDQRAFRSIGESINSIESDHRKMQAGVKKEEDKQ